MKKIVIVILSALLVVSTQVDAGTIINNTNYNVSIYGYGTMVLAPRTTWQIPPTAKKLSGIELMTNTNFEGDVDPRFNYELILDPTKKQYVIKKLMQSIQGSVVKK